MSDACTLEIAEGVAELTLNRPDALNALDADLSAALQEALASVAGDHAVRAVLLTGAGRAFCSGADLEEAKRRIAEGGTLRPGEILRERYNPIILGIVEMEKPVVCALNGVAAGAGASLALACDVRIASEKASLMQAFVRIGLIPDAGASYFLPRIVGTAKALSLAMSGEAVDAATCLSLGLADEVVPPEELLPRAREVAARLATGPTHAYGLMKKALRFGAVSDLRSTLDYEADLQDQASTTADAGEGIAAFLEKRRPGFTGR